MKYSLLNCEGDFLLVEKIDNQWYFKLLTRSPKVEGGNPYQLIPTTPLDILLYLRGDWEIFSEDYDTLNYSDYSDNYKNLNKNVSLIKDLIDELVDGIRNNQDEFLKMFSIPPKRD